MPPESESDEAQAFEKIRTAASRVEYFLTTAVQFCLIPPSKVAGLASEFHVLKGDTESPAGRFGPLYKGMTHKTVGPKERQWFSDIATFYGHMAEAVPEKYRKNVKAATFVETVTRFTHDIDNGLKMLPDTSKVPAR